ncbi:hypothetical protein H6F95_22290 [Cyanobacteria bacterium FACHB-471]|nr:hypothetical protein [Cyanobacteria bacterium FACHB-471]
MQRFQHGDSLKNFDTKMSQVMDGAIAKTFRFHSASNPNPFHQPTRHLASHTPLLHQDFTTKFKT